MFRSQLFTRTIALAASAVTLAACGQLPLPSFLRPALLNLPNCAEGANAISKFELIQPTPAPAAAAPAAPAANAPPAAPAPTPRPAPKTDRVGYPDNYKQTFKLMYVHDRGPNGQARVICGNDLAASAAPGQAYPYGSILVMETYRAKQEAGKIVKDDKGHFIREALAGVFVMRKEQGFGVDYGQWRSGEWEYVAFRPGSKDYATAPTASNSCAACHASGSSEKFDFTFRTSLRHQADHYSQVAQPEANQVVMSSMAYGPGTLTVKKGTKVTFLNRDQMTHNVVANDKSFDSGNIATGAEWIYTFDKVGTFDYTCTYHPDQMRGRIEVRE